MGGKWFLSLFILLSIMDFSINVYAEEYDSTTEPIIIRGAYQSEPVTPNTFEGNLNNLPKRELWKPGDPIIEIPRLFYPRSEQTVARFEEESLVWRDLLLDIQENAVTESHANNFIAPDLNFNGIGFMSAYPPDTVGDVGPNHYIQMVNSSGGSVFAIYNKAGVLQAGPVTLDSLWTAGGLCASGHGDPIVLYDILGNRWLMSEFSSTGNHLCVYISKTPNPVNGGWFYMTSLSRSSLIIPNMVYGLMHFMSLQMNQPLLSMQWIE
jgi:hypothetical protein